MSNTNILGKFLLWRDKNISDRNFLLILSIITGVAGGISAVIIKNLVHLIQEFLAGIARSETSFLFILFPFIGLLLTVMFIRYINRNPVVHGIPSVLYAISKRSGIMKAHNMFSSIITSALTVGFGGSVGLEGPTVCTGSAIGSNLGRALQLNYKQITLLLGCASAGAMAAIFKAPIAAIIFALEVIMLDLTMAAIVPLLLSSATAVITSYLFLGQNVLYSIEFKISFDLNHVVFFVILGIFTGFVSVYFTKIYVLVSSWFEKLPNFLSRLLIGSSALGLLVFLIPSLYGEGYNVINQCLAGNFDYLFDNTFYSGFSGSIVATIGFFLLVIFLKPVATSITFGAGGVGGIFAPTIFIGANSGLLFAKSAALIGISLPMESFALVGMAGLIAGVIHAPLTGMFLIAEITGGYELFVPLMIVAAISYATIKVFIPNSVYTYQLAQRGELITHHKDKAVLLMMEMKEVIEKDFNEIHPDDTLADLIKIIKRAHRNIFPVVEKDGTFRGIVKLDDIRHIIFNPDLYDKIHVRDVMFMPEYVIDPDETMEDVARKFQVSGRYNIAIIKQGKYLGFVSRARLFSAYRRLLSDFSEE